MNTSHLARTAAATHLHAMSFGPNTKTPRTCPRCHVAVPLVAMMRCPACQADLQAPGSPGEGLVEALTSVLGDLTGGPMPPKRQ